MGGFESTGQIDQWLQQTAGAESLRCPGSRSRPPQGCSSSHRQAPCCYLLLAPLLTLNSLGDKMPLPARQGQAHRGINSLPRDPWLIHMESTEMHYHEVSRRQRTMPGHCAVGRLEQKELTQTCHVVNMQLLHKTSL